MTPATPPRFLQQLLLAVLPPNQRETVAGDLQELFAERAARHGHSAAALWYARQVLSFAPHSFSFPEGTLAGLAGFAAVYGIWFGVMELLLRHPGYLRREWIPAILVVQALLTLSFLVFRGIPALGFAVALGCLPLMGLVGLVARGVLRGAEIEGYVLVMALSLALQVLATGLTLWHRSRLQRS
jgi:hypothetical protein